MFLFEVEKICIPSARKLTIYSSEIAGIHLCLVKRYTSYLILESDMKMCSVAGQTNKPYNPAEFERVLVWT